MMGITEDEKKFNASCDKNRHFITPGKQKVIWGYPEKQRQVQMNVNPPKRQSTTDLLGTFSKYNLSLM